MPSSSPIAALVETLKRSSGCRRVRNGVHLHLLCAAVKLRRAERLIA